MTRAATTGPSHGLPSEPGPAQPGGDRAGGPAIGVIITVATALPKYAPSSYWLTTSSPGWVSR